VLARGRRSGGRDNEAVTPARFKERVSCHVAVLPSRRRAPPTGSSRERSHMATNGKAPPNRVRINGNSERRSGVRSSLATSSSSRSAASIVESEVVTAVDRMPFRQAQ
jgi:hypothetical protein